MWNAAALNWSMVQRCADKLVYGRFSKGRKKTYSCPWFAKINLEWLFVQDTGSGYLQAR